MARKKDSTPPTLFVLSIVTGSASHSLLVPGEAATAAFRTWKDWLNSRSNTGNELLQVCGYADQANRKEVEMFVLLANVVAMEWHRYGD